MSEDRKTELTPLRVLQELTTLASMDRRRGINHWHDAALTDDLRKLAQEVAREIASGSAGGGATRKPATPPSGRSGRASGESAVRKPSGPAASSAKSGIDQVRQAIGGKVRKAKPPSRPAPSGAASSPPSASGGAPAPTTPGPGSSPANHPPAAPRRPQTPSQTSPGPSRPKATPDKAPKIPSWPAPPLAAGRDGDWEERLQRLDARAQECRKCGLCETRNKVVFGVGSSAVPLVFVGEAPGADEDRQGYPFVGRAGQLLDKIIQAIGLSRDEIYICNILKCRPPENRNPAPEEIASCTPYLEEQLEILRPKVICTLGLFASQFLVESKLSMGKLRGQKLSYKTIPVVPTYHPAFLLRDPSFKAKVWEDVKVVRRILDE